MTVGQILNELFNELRANFGDLWDMPADEEWTRYKITFSETLDTDCPPWVGTDYS